MIGAVRNETAERQLAFIGGHPELGSRVGQAADLTDASQSEQGSLGLNGLSADEFATFSRLNQAYRDKFRFPFIICVRRHTRNSILRNFERRLGNDIAAERAQALTEIGLITRLRLVALVDGPGAPVTTGRLSAHVLDTTTGRPAPGIKVTLHEIGGSARGLIAEAVTNTDGRTDKPLISGEPLRIGTYELTFQVGGYFQRRFSRRRADPLRHRGAGGALPRAVARDAVELYDLPRKLDVTIYVMAGLVPAIPIRDAPPATDAGQAGRTRLNRVIDLYTWTTPNGRKISIALEEMGLPYTAHAVDISKDEQFKPEFLKISPNNRIPAIVDRDNGLSLMESGAILQYLGDKTGKLLPKSGEKRWRTLEWLNWQMGGPGPMLGQVHHFTKYNPGKAPYAEERYLKEGHRLYKVLNTRLEGREYVADDYSIADIAIWPWISRYEWQTIDLNQYPNVKRWYLTIAKKPATQKGYKVPKDVGEVPIPA